ncbi:hypothetical protein ACFY4K_30505 [Streptomyces leeuwenhoekii]|uniref:hypothetical protein n=1 Tax=Streptomyces leeuwenhoekii TaxID=1437453 RepID=UPI00367E4633
MKHRGRHRRRRQGRALRAVLAGTALSLTAAATLISASQAQVADGPGALRALDSPAARGELRLTGHRVPAAWLDRLSSAMGRPAAVDAVLGSAGGELRDAAECGAGERAALPVAPAATRAYCWDEADVRGWRPGAVTTSAGAGEDGRWGGRRVIASAWTSEAGDGADDGRAPLPGPGADGDDAGAGAQRGADGPGGEVGGEEIGGGMGTGRAGGGGGGTGAAATGPGLSRVAFVDTDAPGRPRHVSALLVVPVDGGRDYRGLSSPVSGMAWYRDKLLVTAGAGDRAALYVYDVDRLLRADVGGDAVGRVPGGWSAHGYRYVLPAVAAYHSAADGPRPAALSLDRTTTPDSVVAAERVSADAARPARLWRYALREDPAPAGPLAADRAGHVDAVEAYETRATGIGGVLAHRAAGAGRGAWYLSHAAGAPESRAALGRQDGEGAEVVECGADRSRHCWSADARSLAYREDTGEVWSQSGRMLFALPLSSLDASLH